jgi:hypothetical protein
MMEVFFNLMVAFSLGHFTSVLAVYLNHRFVFHGRLGRLPILRKFRKLHIKHHLCAYNDDKEEYFEPPWVKVVFFILVVIVGFISAPFSLGLLSFGALYAYRHKRIHSVDKTSKFSLHHAYHHKVDSRVNYSGVYPIIDYFFGTNRK